MKRLTLLMFLSVIFSSARAQSNPDDIIRKFFAEYKTNTDAAVQNLYNTNKWANANKEGVDNIKREFRSLTEDFIGKYYGYELLTMQSSTSDFLLYVYLVKYDRQPLKFTFEFYKPNDKWVLYSFKYDDTIDDDVEHAAEYFLSQPK